MTDADVYAEILRATEDRRSRRVYPYHVSLLEMRRWAFRAGASDVDLLASLRRLREAGNITSGRTLNGWWIRPSGENADKPL